MPVNVLHWTMTEKSTPSRAAGLVTVQLGAALKTDWVQWCHERNLVPGKALRTLVEKALTEGLELTTNVQGTQVMVRVGRGPDYGRKIGREIYFTPSENAAIEAVAQKQRYGFHDWVIAAVRAALAQAPSYGQSELRALTESNAMLAQIVIDLGALRKGVTDADLAEQMRVLERGVKVHVEAASALMAQGEQRWLLKV